MFPILLKRLRENENLTQKQLAEILNISRSSLASYETGAREPDFVILKNIAAYFNVTIDYLLNHSVKEDEEEEISEQEPNISLKNKIDSLNNDSLKELEKYIDLLKISEIYSSSEKTSEDRDANIS